MSKGKGKAGRKVRGRVVKVARTVYRDTRGRFTKKGKGRRYKIVYKRKITQAKVARKTESKVVVPFRKLVGKRDIPREIAKTHPVAIPRGKVKKTKDGISYVDWTTKVFQYHYRAYWIPDYDPIYIYDILIREPKASLVFIIATFIDNDIGELFENSTKYQSMELYRGDLATLAGRLSELAQLLEVGPSDPNGAIDTDRDVEIVSYQVAFTYPL